MRVKLDYTDTSEARNFDPAPAGIYRLKIDSHEDGTTQTGRDKVVCKCKIVNSCPQKGKVVKHTVTVIPGGEPGAGFIKHFLRVIGQPHEGQFSMDSEKWDGAEFIARIEVEDSVSKGITYHNNKIAESWHQDDADVPQLGPIESAPKAAKEILKERQAAKTPNAESDAVPF